MEEVQHALYEAPNFAGYSSSGNVSIESSMTNSEGQLDGGNIASTAAASTGLDSNIIDISADANTYSHDPKTTKEDASVGAAYDANANNDASAGPSGSHASQDNVSDISSHLAGYNSLNGTVSEITNYQSASALENGGLSSDVNPQGEQAYESVVYSAEEERLWHVVRTNCLDFDSWIALIEETEKVAEIDIAKIRRVYDAFFAEFPLCYGYWKKYADHEGRLSSVEKVVEVYERAVLAVTYSVDIWLHYSIFAIATYGDPDTNRRLFERGLAYVGTDYQSHQLWDEYIRYEESHQAWSNLAMIYTRILEHPIQQLDRYFNCFKELAVSHPLSEIQTPEEVAILASTTETSGQGIEGEVHPEGAEQSSKLVNGGLTEAEEMEKYIAIREEMYKKAKEFDSKIIGFETAIRRPYFHVRPLDDAELENWHNYLDFVERGEDFNKTYLLHSVLLVVKLYERCLIACANYPELWIRYILCMEASGSMELANNALARATQVFVKKQPEIHLFAARFKELSADVYGARTEYEILYSEVSSSFFEAVVRHANMEYRLGDKEAAFSVYERAIAVEREKEHSDILPFLLVQFSRFFYLVVGDAEKSREILAAHLEQMQLTKPLLEAVIHLESIQPLPKRVEYLDSLVEKFITPNHDDPYLASMVDREELSCIFLEFMDLFGDAQLIKKAENRHAMLFLRQRNVLVSRKRRAEDSLASDKTKLTKAFSDQGQSVLGAYQSVQGQWPAGYGQKNPTWPPTSQPQVQWNAAYAPQAGYAAAYGGYTNYSNPQVAASAPQAAAYAAYPPTYSAQAYPQQTYVQPTAATAVAPAYPQQPAAAQQYYY